MVQSADQQARRSTKNNSGQKPAVVSGDLSSPDYSLPFFHYLTIPKSTARTSPLTYTLELPIGVIYRVWVEFPRGCSGLAGVQIWRATRQIFPLPEDTWLRSDNAILNFAFTHNILTEPYEVELRGYNIDDTFDHTIWFGLEMRGKESDLSPQLSSLIRALKG